MSHHVSAALCLDTSPLSHPFPLRVNRRGGVHEQESFQKAARMVDPANPGLEPREFEDVVDALTVPTEARPYAIMQALKQGEIHARTHSLPALHHHHHRHLIILG